MERGTLTYELSPLYWVLPLFMVDNSISPLRTHFGLIFSSFDCTTHCLTKNLPVEAGHNALSSALFPLLHQAHRFAHATFVKTKGSCYSQFTKADFSVLPTGCVYGLPTLSEEGFPNIVGSLKKREDTLKKISLFNAFYDVRKQTL